MRLNQDPQTGRAQLFASSAERADRVHARRGRGVQVSLRVHDGRGGDAAANSVGAVPASAGVQIGRRRVATPASRSADVRASMARSRRSWRPVQIGRCRVAPTGSEPRALPVLAMGRRYVGGVVGARPHRRPAGRRRNDANGTLAAYIRISDGSVYRTAQVGPNGGLAGDVDAAVGLAALGHLVDVTPGGLVQVFSVGGDARAYITQQGSPNGAFQSWRTLRRWWLRSPRAGDQLVRGSAWRPAAWSTGELAEPATTNDPALDCQASPLVIVRAQAPPSELLAKGW